MNQKDMKCKVLVVEDCPDTSMLFTRLFRALGAEVITANNGELGVGLVDVAAREGKPFQLILTDIRMPAITGLQAAKMIREKGFTGVIAACSADATPDDKSDSRVSGVDVYFDKTKANRDIFIDLVQRACSRNDFLK